MAEVDVLDREMFSEAEAARFLHVKQGTLHYWLEGGEVRGRTYRPIIRVEPTGRRSVTWAEFVEAGLLREYRRTHRVPMAKLRAVIDLLRERYGMPYPLADKRPYVSGRELLLEAQNASGLDPDFCLVAVASDQLILTPPSQSFIERVTWDADVAVAWRPHTENDSPVRIAPTQRFGKPQVNGISTEVLWEHVEAGEDEHEVAEAFGLELGDVRWALSYELSMHSRAV